MASELTFGLNSLSVVVTAEYHNPSILTPNFLVSQGIVLQDWEVLETITTPAFSTVNYKDRPQWIVEQNKLIIVETCDSQFQDKYEVHDLATRYLDIVRLVPYRSLGLNWHVWTHLEDPGRWLTDRFLSSEVRSQDLKNLQDLKMEPRFTFSANRVGADEIVKMSISSGQVAHTGQASIDAAIVECNVHHQGPLDAQHLISAIGRWAVHQESIIEVLNVLFGSGQQ